MNKRDLPAGQDGVADPAASPEHFEQPTAFGRLRWWFEESPMALTASAALALVSCGFLFILTSKPLRADAPLVSVALQAVSAESLASDNAPKEENATEFQTLSGSEEPQRDPVEEMPKLPELPRTEVNIDPKEVLGNQGETQKQLEETDAAIRQAGDMLRKMLEANQRREQGSGAGAGDGGAGQVDPNSTPGRQARWVISYPPIPQGEYERMLDAFRIELAYVDADRRTMQYLAGVSGAGRKRTGDITKEDRMFWFWVENNRLRDVDEAIFRRHGLEPASETVHLYSKELEHKLAEMEKEHLGRQFKTSNVDRIAQTTFRLVAGGPNGWHVEVTGMTLR
jgi:hypothetical protein